jgi:DNA-binding NarL/FixJ family response regulator
MDILNCFLQIISMVNVEVLPARKDAVAAGRSRILVADDHEVVRKGLRSILALHDNLEICGEASNGEEAVLKAFQLNPDLIILDVTMPLVDGFSAARQIRKILPGVRILILSMHNDPTIVERSRLAEAQGFVTKTDVVSTLLLAVEALLQGQTFFAPDNG